MPTARYQDDSPDLRRGTCGTWEWSIHMPTFRSRRSGCERVPERRARSRGQSLVEFAIVVPVFMLFLGGVVQFGMIFWGQNTINQIVRDGGRYAATVTDCTGTNSTVTKDVQDRTTALANGTILAGKLTVAVPTWSPAGACPDSNAKVVWVTVSASGTVPIFFPWLPGNGTVSSAAQYRVEPVQS